MTADPGAEPISRLAARSVAELCAGAPACHEAMRLGAEPLIRSVDQDALLGDRLLQLSRTTPPPPAADVDAPFERSLIFLVEDLGDHGVDEILVFGAGLYGRLFGRLARLAHVRIRSFVDNNAAPGALEGTPVVSLDEARSIRDLPFVICTKAGCAAVMSQLAPIQVGEKRLVFTHVNSWRSQLGHDPALDAADAACRRAVREAVEGEAPWATAYLLCNYRRIVHDWAAAATAGRPVRAISPFVYQMQ